MIHWYNFDYTFVIVKYFYYKKNLIKQKLNYNCKDY